MKKKVILASTVALSFAPALATQAEEVHGQHVPLSKFKMT